MDCKKNKRNIFQRAFGICITKEPADKLSWYLDEKTLSIDLEKASELKKPGSGLRFEDDNFRLLVVHFEDDSFAAYDNRCLHGKRRLDLVEGTETVQCCSMGATTYDKSGKVLCGDVKGELKTYKLTRDYDNLIIHLN